MKKLSVLVLLITNILLFNSCKKEPIEPEDNINNNTNNTIIISSPFTWQAKLDGKQVTYTEGKDNLRSGAGSVKEIVGSPDTSYAVFTSAFYRRVGWENDYVLIVSKGTMSMIGGQPENSDFKDFFKPGSYPFDYFDDNFRFQGINISFFENDVEWSSNGDQTNSYFRIEEIKEETLLNEYRIRYLAKFACNVYDPNGNVKRITDGVIVSYFANR